MSRKCDICKRSSTWQTNGDGIIYAYCNRHSPIRVKQATVNKRKPNTKILSPGQIDVIILIGVGTGYEAIAEQLDVSITTVKYQVSCAIHKLGFKNKTQLARYAWENDLVDRSLA